MAQGRCIVCKEPGRRLVLVGRKTGPIVCAKHESTVRIGAQVAGAATKAGVIAGLEAARPGLYQSLAEAYWTIKKVVSGSGPSSSTDG